MQALKLGNFLVGTHQGQISLSKEGEGQPLIFGSGEAASIKELLGIALSMESVSVLPEHIDQGRVQIRFHEDNTLSLHCGDDGGVSFSWIEGDELITRVEDGYKMIMNERQVGSVGMKPVTSMPESGEPFI